MRLFTYRRAGAVVIDGDRVVLCSMQPPGRRRWWMFPGGGIEDGESPTDAACRELFEETGLRAEGCEEYLHAGVHGGEHRYYLITTRSLDIGAVSGPELDYAANADFRAEWVPIADLPHIPVFPRCVAEHVATYGRVVSGTVAAIPRVEDDRNAWDGVANEPPHFELRRTSRAVIVTDRGIAAIERELGNERWYTLPGGGIEEGESAEHAVAREVREEVGLDVRPARRLAVVYLARAESRSLQTFLACQVAGGEFATGTGPEFTAERRRQRGTYKPVWLDPTDLPRNLRPAWLSDRLVTWSNGHKPQRPERFCEFHD